MIIFCNFSKRQSETLTKVQTHESDTTIVSFYITCKKISCFCTCLREFHCERSCQFVRLLGTRFLTHHIQFTRRLPNSAEPGCTTPEYFPFFSENPYSIAARLMSVGTFRSSALMYKEIFFQFILNISNSMESIYSPRMQVRFSLLFAFSPVSN